MISFSIWHEPLGINRFWCMFEWIFKHRDMSFFFSSRQTNSFFFFGNLGVQWEIDGKREIHWSHVISIIVKILFFSLLLNVVDFIQYNTFCFNFRNKNMSSVLIDNDSSSSISNEIDSLVLSRVRTIVKFYIWPLLVIFGVTGNSLSILVLTRRRLIRTSTNNYLTILAAFDCCYLISTLLLNFGTHSKFSQYSLTSTFIFALRPLADFSSNTATWLIVCFTLERTLAVARPIYAKQMCSVRRSRRLIVSVLLISFLITLPTLFEQKLIQRQFASNSTESMEKFKEQTRFFQNLHRFYLIFICIVIIWIPLLIISVCNSILIWFDLIFWFHWNRIIFFRFVHRSRHFGGKTRANSFSESEENSSSFTHKLDYSTSNSFRTGGTNPFYLRRHRRSVVQKRKVTIILICCLFVALLLWTPQSLSLTYEIFFENYHQMSRDHQTYLLIFNNFANLFLCINASIDFILYCFLSDKFARTCRQILCRQCSHLESEVQRRSRVLSIHRTSIVLQPTPSENRYRYLAANTTNDYYLQIYDFYRHPATQRTIPRKKQKKPISSTMKCDRKIFYQQSLSKMREQLHWCYF